MERRTRQKQAIEAVLEQHLNPMTPVEIHQLALRDVPTIGLATVYRFLRTMAADGQVVTVEIPGQPPRYEKADKGHHHHFVCRECKNVFELERCLEGIKSMAPSRFRVDDHEIILYGVCEMCLAQGKGTVPPKAAEKHDHHDYAHAH